MYKPVTTLQSMALNSRTRRLIGYSMILVSTLSACGNIHTPKQQAQAAETGTLTERAQAAEITAAQVAMINDAEKYLNSAKEQLKAAEQKKKEDPKSYISALLQVSSQATNYDAASRKVAHSYESQQGNEYFKLAVDFYSETQLNKEDNAQSAGTIWNGSRNSSSKIFESVFEEIFKASERYPTENYSVPDADIWLALSRREEQLPVAVQKRLLERAIGIRSKTFGPNSRQLATLYQNMAYCCLEDSDVAGAEKNFQRAIALLAPDPVEQSHKMVDLAQFYANNQLYYKADNMWRSAASLTKTKHLVWYTSGFVSLINALKNHGQSNHLLPIFETLLADGDDFTFVQLDTHLVELIDTQIKLGQFSTAANLVEKRIAIDVNSGKKAGSEDWKVRLSNIYLAEGKTKQSESIFNSVISDLEARSLPTTELKNNRAKLLENMGMLDEAQKLETSFSKTASDIVLPSSMVIKDKIEFGNSASITSFDSSDQNDPIARTIGAGAHAVCYATTTPPEGDGSSILCMGTITGPCVAYSGKIFCNDANVTPPRGGKLRIAPVAQTLSLQDGISPSPDAKTNVVMLDGHEKILERGDYILTDLGELTVRPQVSSLPIRIFLEDSPDKKDFELSLNGPSVTFRQLQLWYRGKKNIKIRRGNGLIYAPNASVELEFGTGFMGAIVAKQFKTSNGIGSIFLDRGIVNRNLTR